MNIANHHVVVTEQLNIFMLSLIARSQKNQAKHNIRRN